MFTEHIAVSILLNTFLSFFPLLFQQYSHYTHNYNFIVFCYFLLLKIDVRCVVGEKNKIFHSLLVHFEVAKAVSNGLF